jgi:signal transduction histidine kinase
MHLAPSLLPTDLATAASFPSQFRNISSLTTMGSTPVILVADDIEPNRDLLEAWLTQEGYDVLQAADGRAALECLRRCPVDLVLLDVMMPGLDGFEVCRQIKSDPAFGFIPVVLVTVLKEVEDRINANEANADDFLSKPIDHGELLSRVKSLLRLKQMHEQLLRMNQQLEEQNKKLFHLQQMREDLTQFLVHDLQNLLTVIYCSLEILRAETEKGLRGNQENFILNAIESCEELRNMLLNLLDISVLEQDALVLRPEEIHLEKLTKAVLNGSLLAAAKRQQVIFRDKVSGELLPVVADRDLVKRVLLNLLGNALKFSPQGSQITVEGHCREGELVCEVMDEGPGIPEEFRTRIFEKFSQVEAKKSGVRTGRGLGLAFCKIAVEAHGGRIWVENAPSHGSRFCFSLPLSKPSSPVPVPDALPGV